MLSEIFFFFKQKKAYEIRISDWSSDVCSSDLKNRRPAARRRKESARRSRPHRRHPGRRHRSQVADGRLAQRRRVEGRRVAVNPSAAPKPRSEERDSGTECVSQWSTRWLTYH